MLVSLQVSAAAVDIKVAHVAPLEAASVYLKYSAAYSSPTLQYLPFQPHC